MVGDDVLYVGDVGVCCVLGIFGFWFGDDEVGCVDIGIGDFVLWCDCYVEVEMV